MENIINRIDLSFKNSSKKVSEYSLPPIPKDIPKTK